MELQKVVMACNLEEALGQAINDCGPDRIFILTDETTQRLCLPVVQHFSCLKGAKVITIPAGDTNKSLESVCHVWNELQHHGATRHSMMVNLGGGMVTDLGGFAASTFKRGLHYINIPTTLLSMVDASVGGKTGFNYGGLKNEIGVFSNADCVLLDTTFLRTLDHENILSGYAEMLKHGLISDKAHWAELLDNDLLSTSVQASDSNRQTPTFNLQSSILERSVAVKQRIVEKDPTEKGIRKALNLGHTIGHAFEALSLASHPSPLTPHPSPLTSHPSPLTSHPSPLTSHPSPLTPHPSPLTSHPSPLTPHHSPLTTHPSPLHPILHGYAVAYGLVCELYLSVVKTGFPQDKMRQTVNFIRENYGRMPITCDDYPTLLELMTHDKKNTVGTINFTLLADIGDIRIDQTATEKEITEALDFYREGF